MINVLAAGVLTLIATIATGATIDAWRAGRRWNAGLRGAQAAAAILLIAATSATVGTVSVSHNRADQTG